MSKLLYNNSCAVCEKKNITTLIDHMLKNKDILCLAYCTSCVKKREKSICIYCKEAIQDDNHWYLNDRHYICDNLRIRREKGGFCIKCGEESVKRYCKKHDNSSKYVGYGIQRVN